MNKSFIKITNISKHFGNVKAVDDVSFEIGEGEFFSLLGPSGCGKTTLLRLLAGFEYPSSGNILIDGADITAMPPDKRPTNMVFQNYAIFPHLNVEKNIQFGLRKLGLSKNEIDKKVKNVLRLVKLEGYEERFSNQLSGGQRQRVALARALVRQPKVLLLDEPLGALDKKLRDEMQLELRTLQKNIGITFVFVTHDQEEALTMSDRIAVVNEGKIQQVGKPEEIYERPKNKFVADFIGEANLLIGTCLAEGEKGICKLDIGQEISLPLSPKIKTGDRVTIFIRPERIKISKSTSENSKTIIKEFTYLGNSASILINANEQIINANIPVEDVKTFKAGDYIKIELPKENLQVIDA